MSAKIYVPAIDGWDFFEDNIGGLKEKSVEIASGDDTFIYMTEYAGLPLLTVECLGVDVEIVPITSSAELYYHLGRLYRDYILLPDENSAESTPDESSEEDAEALSRDELAIRRLCRSYTSFPDENIVELEPDEPTDWDDEKLSDDELAILRDDELMCATQDFLTVLLSKEDYEDLFACFEFDTCREVLMSICNMFWETYAIDIDWPLTERDMGVLPITSAESLTLKVGDLVRVLPREMHSKKEACAFPSGMEAYIGTICEVERVFRRIDHCIVSLRTEDGVPCEYYGFHWYFYPSFIERVIENDVCPPDVCMLESLFLAAK